MAKRNAGPAAKSSPLLQFRATMELEQLVKPFADRNRLTLSAAFKDLAALAVIGLDHRHYPLVEQLAAVMRGENAFPKSCVYLHAALAGAALARGGAVLYEEPARTQLVFDVVEGYLADRGVKVNTEGLWITPVSPAPDPARRDETEGNSQADDAPTDTNAGTTSTFGKPPVRRVFPNKR